MSQLANPFGGQQGKTMAQATSLVEVESQRAIQEVQAALVIAKKFPRDQIEAMDRILNACSRPTLAEGALYEYARGGSTITGPSIRLAEAIAQEWGNMQFGIRELSQANGESTVEAFAWDVERNTRQVKVFQVPHIRYTKNGSKALTDPRDVYELVANQGARRLRACILGVIPGDVIEAATRQCDVTLKSNCDVGPEAQRKMIDAFAPFGVTKEAIEKRIQRRLDTITPALMVQLKKIYASLRDGMGHPSDWFEVPQQPGNSKPAEAVDVEGLSDEIMKLVTADDVNARWAQISKLCADAGNLAAQKALKKVVTDHLAFIKSAEVQQ